MSIENLYTFAAPLIQGDVVLKRLTALPEGARLVEKDNKVLQSSEVTGHHHQFTAEANVSLYSFGFDADGTLRITPNDNKVIEVHTDSVLFHGKLFEAEPHKSGSGDHNCLTVPAGLYHVDIVREYDPDTMETRRVVD